MCPSKQLEMKQSLDQIRGLDRRDAAIRAAAVRVAAETPPRRRPRPEDGALRTQMRRVADAMRAAAATRPPHAPFAFGFDGALAVSTLPTRGVQLIHVVSVVF